MKALLIDHDADRAAEVSHLLLQQGFDVTGEADIAAARGLIITHHRFDLIVCAQITQETGYRDSSKNTTRFIRDLRKVMPPSRLIVYRDDINCDR